MAAPQHVSEKWIGPAIKISFPSFSGRTEYHPHLLKYSCQIECRLRMVSPAEVMGPCASDRDGEIVSEGETPNGFCCWGFHRLQKKPEHICDAIETDYSFRV